jgi:hypothetical protein
MSEGQSGNRLKVLGIVLLVVLLGWGCVSLYQFLSNQPAPPKAQAPDFIPPLRDLQTVCVNRAKALKGEGIDGASEYEKAQGAANEFIGYLEGVLSSGSGDQEQIKKRLEKMVAECGSFVGWADERLSKTSAAVDSVSIDISAFTFGVMKLLDNQETERRKAFRESLQGCKFPSWTDISSDAGRLKKKPAKK